MEEGKLAIAQIKSSIAQPARPIFDRMLELHRRFDGLIEGWREMGNRPVTAGDSTHLVTDLLPDATASISSVLADVPAIRMLVAAVDRVTPSLEALALPPNDLLGEQCRWARAVDRRGRGVLERLPHLANSADILNALKGILVSVVETLGRLETVVEDIAGTVSAARSTFQAMAVSGLNETTYGDLLRASAVATGVDMDTVDGLHHAVQGMDAFITVALGAHLSNTSAGKVAIARGVPYLKQTVGQLFDALLVQDPVVGEGMNRGDSVLQSVGNFINTAHAKIMNFSEVQQHCTLYEEDDDEAKMHKRCLAGLVYQQHLKRLLKIMPAFYDAGDALQDLLAGTNEAIVGAGVTAQSATFMVETMGTLLNNSAEASEIAAKLSQLGSEVHRLKGAMAGVHPNALDEISRAAQLLSTDVWDDLAPEWLAKEAFRLRRNAGSVLGLLEDLNYMHDSEELLVELIGNSSQVIEVCSANRGVPTVKFVSPTRTSSPVEDTLTALREIYGELLQFVDADPASVSDPDKVATVLLSLIQTSQKLRGLLKMLEGMSSLDQKATGILSAAVAAINAVETPIESKSRSSEGETVHVRNEISRVQKNSSHSNTSGILLVADHLA
jgi:hypothetical protein